MAGDVTLTATSPAKSTHSSVPLIQIARPRWPNVGPPVAPPLGHRWQPPVCQRHFGRWANVGPTVACGMPVGPPVGQRHFGQWANVGPTVACGMPVGPPVGHRWANISATVGPMINSDKCSTVFKTLFTNS